MSKFIIKPDGKPVSIGEYVRSWRIIKAGPHTAIIAGFEPFPCTAAEILRKISRGVEDRINRRAVPGKSQPVKTEWPDVPHYRLERRLSHAAGHVSECRWCGSLIPWLPREIRFCDRSCRHAYHS
jgi:hypothetical protein